MPADPCPASLPAPVPAAGPRGPLTRRGLCFALGLAPWMLRAQPAPRSLSLSVVPQFPAAALHRDWSPLLERLGRDLGLSLQLQIAQDIPRFETELAAGRPDLAYLNPYHQLQAHRQHGYLPLVRDRQPLTGLLVVRRDSPLQDVRGLDGQTLVFPAPNAFGASLWMRALLIERDGLRFTPRYVQTHNNVYRHVALGLAPAGGGVNHTLSQEREEVRRELRVLMETPGAAPHPLSAHPRVPAPLRQALRDGLLALTREPEGQALLREVQLPNLVPADQQADYQPLARYHLERHVDAGSPR